MKQFTIIILFSILFSACNTTVKKTISNNNLKIVSLAPSITKELQTLGLTKSIVGATSYCEITKTNKELIIGSTTNINIEKILLLKPDIVFTTNLTKKSSIDALKNNGIKIHRINKMRSFNDICKEFIGISKETNKENLAHKIVSNAKHQLDSILLTIPHNKDSTKVFIQIGAKPLYTVIPNTFMNDYITFANCTNIANNLKQGIVSRETVINRNPDVIFIVTMGILGDKEKEIWESFKNINAVKKHKVFIIDSNIACTPTVSTFLQALKLIVHNIYN